MLTFVSLRLGTPQQITKCISGNAHVSTLPRMLFFASWTDRVYYVRDNGIGISKEYHEMIFGIFKRLHGRNEFGGGTGAGLAIVKKIVERHKGKIWLHSLPGQETTFYFTLDEGE